MRDFVIAVKESLSSLQNKLDTIPPKKAAARQRLAQRMKDTRLAYQSIMAEIEATRSTPIKIERDTVERLCRETPYTRYTEGYFNYHRELVNLLDDLNRKRIISCFVPQHYQRPERGLITKGSSQYLDSYDDFLTLCHRFITEWPLHEKHSATDLAHGLMFSLMLESFCAFPRLPGALAQLERSEIDSCEGALYLSPSREKERYIRVPLSDRGHVILNALLLADSSKRPCKAINPRAFNKWTEQFGMNLTFTAARMLSIMHSSMNMPPFVLGVMSNRIPASGLSPEDRKRLYHPAYSPHQVAVTTRVRQRASSVTQSTHRAGPTHNLVIDELQKAISETYRNQGKTTAALRRSVARVLDDHADAIAVNETLRLVGEWITAQLGDRKVKLGTVRTYFRPFARQLLAETSETPLSHMSPSEIIDLIEHIIETDLLNRTDNPQNMGRRVKSFFRWYVRAYSGHDEYGEILEFLNSSTLHGASANIRTAVISPHEFDLFVGYLANHYPDDAPDMILISALAFWAGLRRSEIERFQTRHLMIGEETFYRIPEAKSESGRRAVQLWALMPEHYRSMLESRAQEMADQKHLFWNNEEERDRLSRELFPSIIAALKHYFNKPNLVLHSLRHSCASWMLLRRFRTRHPMIDSVLPSPFWSQYQTDDNERRFQRLFVQGDGDYDIIALWRIAESMGHLTPEITLQTYIHSIEWIVEALMEEHAPTEETMSYRQIMSLFPGTDHGTFRQKLLANGIVSRGSVRIENVAEWALRRLKKSSAR